MLCSFFCVSKDLSEGGIESSDADDSPGGAFPAPLPMVVSCLPQLMLPRVIPRIGSHDFMSLSIRSPLILFQIFIGGESALIHQCLSLIDWDRSSLESKFGIVQDLPANSC